MSNIVIDIAAEFTGNKAFKQAETSTDKLGKSVKSLAKTFGLAFSATAVLAYGKAAVKAAAADEKAQKQLALALKNVGLGRDAASSEAYIQKLQSEFGILDDKLRPAYHTLAVATRDSAEAQRLLNLALNISASTGKDLASTSSALSKAFLGNNTALSKLGVGISKADLKAGKFEDIVSKLETTFAGSATAAANTFQGSMDKLGVASANVSEIIGTGLIDALKALGDDNTIDEFSAAMESTALYLADVVRGVGQLISYVKQASAAAENIPVLNKVLEATLSLPFFLPTRALNKLGQNSRGGKGGFPQGLPSDLANFQDSMAQYIKPNTKATVDNTAALKKVAAKFDLKKIGLAAALSNPNISADTGNRLRALQSIENGDTANAIKYGNVVKPNASMASPNATVVNVYPQGNVLTEQDLITSIQNGIERNFYRQFGVGAFDK